LGDFYFRVFPLSKQGRRGPVSKTIVWHVRPAGPIWNYKDNLLSIAIPRDKDDQLLSFPETEMRWVPWNSKQKYLKLDLDKILSTPIKYILESSMDSDFVKVEKNEFSVSNMILKNLNSGFYYYRVRAVYLIRNKEILSNLAGNSTEGANNSAPIELISLASKVLRVEVYELQKDGLMAPIISSKIPDGILNGEQQASTLLKWDKNGSAVKFKVQVAEDSAFNALVLEEMVDQNQVALLIKKSGQYFVRVAGISNKNRVGPWSSSSSWDVHLGSILLEPVDALVVSLPQSSTPVPPGLFTVKWFAPFEVNQFQIELAESSNFNKLNLKEIVKSKNYQLKIEVPGKYYFRVKGLNARGAELTPYSKVEMVRYFVKKPLQSPQLILPKDRVSYILSKIENPEVWLEWEGDKLSNQYVIEFSTDRNFKKILYLLKPRENRILLDHESIRGKVFWRVKGINDDQGLESPWSTPRSLSVVDIESDD
jgi:hypothetical protein